MTFSRRRQWTEEDVDALPTVEHDYFDGKAGALVNAAGMNNLNDVLTKFGFAFVNSGGSHLVNTKKRFFCVLLSIL